MEESVCSVLEINMKILRIQTNKLHLSKIKDFFFLIPFFLHFFHLHLKINAKMKKIIQSKRKNRLYFDIFRCVFNVCWWTSILSLCHHVIKGKRARLGVSACKDLERSERHGHNASPGKQRHLEQFDTVRGRAVEALNNPTIRNDCGECSVADEWKENRCSH